MAVRSGEQIELAGELTVRDPTRSLTVTAEVHGDEASATVSAQVEIDRGLWGVSWAKVGTGLKNQVAVRAHFDRA